MAVKKKIRYVELNANKDSFVSRLTGSKKAPDFSDISLLRSLLSNEKSRIFYILKTTNPGSIYALAKLLGRDFKSVRNDLLLLERFGFIEFLKEKSGKRVSLRPILTTNRIEIIIDI